MDVPAGWYPDPASPTSARWWDGTGWTEHTTTLEALGVTTPGTGVPADGTPTVVVPASAPEFLPPLAAPVGAGDTAVYPTGPAYTDTAVYTSPYAAPAGHPAPPPPARPSSVGWVVGALVLVLVLVLAGAAFLLLHARSADDTSGSALPTVTPSAPASGAAPADAAQAASVLETFQPPASSLPQGVTATLVPQGDAVQGQKTLDGWCSESYASEKDRIARRQWVLTQNGQDLGLSVETVAYGTADQAAAALAEFTSTTSGCHDVSLTDSGAQLVQNLVSIQALSGLPAGITGEHAVVTQKVTPSTGSAYSLHSSSTVQRKGQYVTIVWTNQSTPITADDQQVIDRFVAQQTAALATTSS